jgi:hypothetical protein
MIIRTDNGNISIRFSSMLCDHYLIAYFHLLFIIKHQPTFARLKKDYIQDFQDLIFLFLARNQAIITRIYETALLLVLSQSFIVPKFMHSFMIVNILKFANTHIKCEGLKD